METAQDFQTIKSRLSDRWWRLNNLYYIIDKSGNKVKFKSNWAQKDLYDNLHYFNVILKARQLGFTTFIMIYFLDACLFNSNHAAGVIAHTREDAQELFDKKIKFAYDNLPEWLKQTVIAKNDTLRMLRFSNGSSIITGTSLRSGTYQKLLVSEYGKVSAKYPEKAKEIKTGALNTVEAGQQIFVESTAEGKIGEFYTLTENARKLSLLERPLARLEPKFFFYPWYKNPEYRATDEEIQNTVITEEHSKYFKDLSSAGVDLDDGQKAWYVIKASQQNDDMTQEFPSYPDEAFQGSLKGAYYAKNMDVVRKNGQIMKLGYDRRFGVITWWDLGLNDQMSVWFYQYVNGEHRFIDYHESTMQGWDFYAEMLKDKGYNYLFHGFPHDGNKRVRTNIVQKDKDMAAEAGIRPIKITPRTNNVHQDVVNTCAPLLEQCFFDAEKCSIGILHLDNYRRRWSKADGMFLKEPEHDESSHCADAYRTFAVNADKIRTLINPEKKVASFQRGSTGSFMGV